MTHNEMSLYQIQLQKSIQAMNMLTDTKSKFKANRSLRQTTSSQKFQQESLKQISNQSLVAAGQNLNDQIRRHLENLEKDQVKNSSYSSKDLQRVDLITPAKQLRDQSLGNHSKLKNRPPPMLELPPNLRTASQVMQYQSGKHRTTKHK
jgi:hypothetical protein